MNPVLLKPQSEIGSQVVIQGKMWGTAKAAEYQGLKGTFLPAVLGIFFRPKGRGRFGLGRGRRQRL